MKKFFGLILIVIGILIIWKMFLPGVHIGNWTTSMKGPHSAAAPVSGVNTIEIKGRAANIHIVARRQSDLTAQLEGNGNVTVQKSGRDLKVEVHNRWVDWLPIGKQTVLYVYVPESYNRSLNLNLNAGNAVLSGKVTDSPMNLKELSIKMNAGNLRISDLHVQNFNEKGSAGNVHIDRLNTKSADFQLSAGNLVLNHFSGKLKANLSAGQLQVQMDKLIASVDASVSVGNVELDLPEAANTAIDAQVSKGNVTCNLPLKKTTIDEDHHIKGVQGSGKYPVTIKASLGDIRIN